MRSYWLRWGFLCLLPLTSALEARAQYVKASVASFSSSAPELSPDDVPGGTLVFYPATPTEVWIVLVSARLRGTATSGKSAEAFYILDGNFGGIGNVRNSVAGSPGAWQHFGFVTGLGPKVVQVLLSAPDGGTATIENLQIVAFRLPDNADFQFAETPGQQGVSAGVWNGYESLTFTPPSTGDYLVMAVANLNEVTGSSTAGLRVNDSGGSFWPVNASGHLTNGTANWASFFLARIQNLDTSSHTFTLEANGAPGGSVIRETRMIAFRTDVFDNVQTIANLAETATTSTTPQVKSTLTTAASARRDHIVIQSLVLRGSSGTSQRRAGFETDDVVQTSYNHVIADPTISSYGFFDAVTDTGSTKFENTYSTSSGLFTVRAKESVIHTLRLPSCSPRLSFRSIGTAAGVLYNTGTATVDAGAATPTTVDFTGASLPANVGLGDELILDPLGLSSGPETLYVLSRESATRLVVQTPVMVDHTTVSYEIRRAYNTLQAWETARGGDLVGENRREVGVTYADGFFTSGVVFDGSTTDDCSFMWLTVAEGQQHDGTEATFATENVVLEPSVAGHAVSVLDDYTRIQWLEIRNWTGASSEAIHIEADGGFFEYLLIHGATDNESDGIFMENSVGDFTATVRNTIIYDVRRSAIQLQNNAGTRTLVFNVENVTAYNNGTTSSSVHRGGVVNCQATGASSTINAKNVIAVNNGNIDFKSTGGSGCDTTPSWGTSAFNLSSDGTARGASPLANRTVTDNASPGVGAWVIFADVTVGVDLHLQASVENDAVDSGTDLSTDFLRDIDGESRLSPAWDIGADELGATTAVTLSSFTAKGVDGAIALQWETASELDNLGFHLYRSGAAEGPYEAITARPIPGLGSSPLGARYDYLDSGLENGVTYYYRLDDIDTSGRTESHGPVSAMPRGGVAPGSGSPDGIDGDPLSLVTYGDPGANVLRVVERGPFEMTLVLETRGFHAVPQDDGTVLLSIPGFETPEGVSLPVKRTWLETVAGRKAKVVSVRALESEAFESLRPSAHGSELVAAADGTVWARRRAHGRHDPGSSPSAARVVSEGYQGDVKKVLVELSPLRWDDARGELVLATRVVARLSFRTDPSDHATRRGAGRRYRRRPSHAEREVVARLGTTEAGLHRVRFEELLPDHRGRSLRSVRLSRQGEAVPYHLEPSDQPFGPGSVLYFVSEGAGTNPFGNEAVYEVELGVRGRVMRSAPAPPSGATVTSHWHSEEWEENHHYQAALVDAPDVWLWDLLFAPDVKSYRFDVHHLAAALNGPPSRLDLWLQGASDYPGEPDHHLRVRVNGDWAGELSWDGKEARHVEIDLRPGALREGENALEIENVGDTGAPYSMVMLDRYAVTWRHTPQADAGTLRGRIDVSGTAELEGLGDSPYLLDVSESDPTWLTGATLGANGQLRFRVESGRSYLAVAASAVRRPVVTRPRPSDLKNERNGADWIVIGPEAFLEAARPLLELRRSQGMRAEAVSIESVYSAFGFGEPTPEAVRDFVSYAYHRWQEPAPRYVLLLGDATFDFKDHLETGVANHVPPRLVKTSFLWTASDPSYASVNGDDGLPDLAIGRLPAATVEQVEAMVAKILAYETGGVDIESSDVVLIADDADSAGDFEAGAEELAASLLGERGVQKIYLRGLGTTATRTSIVRAFDEGASLVSYLGHGGIHVWAGENLLDVPSVASLSIQARQPVVLTMNCLNGYFHFPYADSLAEALVKPEDKGAIAAFSPSGLSLNRPAHQYHRALLEALDSDRHLRLGDAVLAAQARYAETGAFDELLSIYHLFGDPALVLRPSSPEGSGEP